MVIHAVNLLFSVVMSRLRYLSSTADCATWCALRLNAPLGLPDMRPGDVDPLAPALLLPGGESDVALIARPDARVRLNGRPIYGGLRVLADHDEIQIDGSRFYYSARDPLAVEVYPGPPATCPRCCAMIQPGSPAVRCHCGAWLHEFAPDFGCFTYSGYCPSCNGSTLLEEDPWDPSAL